VEAFLRAETPFSAHLTGDPTVVRTALPPPSAYSKSRTICGGPHIAPESRGNTPFCRHFLKTSDKALRGAEYTAAPACDIRRSRGLIQRVSGGRFRPLADLYPPGYAVTEPFLSDCSGLSRELVGLPRELVDLSRELVGLPPELVDLPPTLVGLSRELVDLPPELVDLPPELVDPSPELVDLPPTLVDLRVLGAGSSPELVGLSPELVDLRVLGASLPPTLVGSSPELVGLRVLGVPTANVSRPTARTSGPTSSRSTYRQH